MLANTRMLVVVCKNNTQAARHKPAVACNFSSTRSSYAERKVCTHIHTTHPKDGLEPPRGENRLKQRHANGTKDSFHNATCGLQETVRKVWPIWQTPAHAERLR